MTQQLSDTRKVWIASDTPVITINKQICETLKIRKGDIIKVTFEKVKSADDKDNREQEDNKKEMKIRNKR